MLNHKESNFIHRTDRNRCHAKRIQDPFETVVIRPKRPWQIVSKQTNEEMLNMCLLIMSNQAISKSSEVSEVVPHQVGHLFCWFQSVPTCDRLKYEPCIITSSHCTNSFELSSPNEDLKWLRRRGLGAILQPTTRGVNEMLSFNFEIRTFSFHAANSCMIPLTCISYIANARMLT